MDAARIAQLMAAVERNENGVEVIPEWAVPGVRALLSSVEAPLHAPLAQPPPSTRAAPTTSSTSLSSSDFKKMLLNLRQSAALGADELVTTAGSNPNTAPSSPDPLPASRGPLASSRDTSALVYDTEGHLRLSSSNALDAHGNARPTLHEFVRTIAASPPRVRTSHPSSSSAAAPTPSFRPGGGNAALALARTSYNARTPANAPSTLPVSLSSTATHATPSALSASLQPRIFASLSALPSTTTKTSQTTSKPARAAKNSTRRPQTATAASAASALSAATSSAAVDASANTSVGARLAASGRYDMRVAERHGNAAAFPFSFDERDDGGMRAQVAAHLVGVHPLEAGDLSDLQRTDADALSHHWPAEVERVRAIAASDPQSRTARVPPGYRVVYFPHVDGAQYCQGEFHEVLLDGDAPLIVHPCYIRDARAPKLPPVPRATAGHETDAQLRHRIGELEALLAFERERQRILLSELQSAHHHELLLQAHVRALEQRCDELADRLADARRAPVATDADADSQRYAHLSDLQRAHAELADAVRDRDAWRTRAQELERELQKAQEAHAAQLAINRALQDEFRRYREQHARGHIELGNANRQLNAALAELLANHERVCGELESERAALRMARAQLDGAQPQLTVFQRLRVLVTRALCNFFQRRYRDEKQRRRALEAEWKGAREAAAHGRGTVEGRLAAEIEARMRAEARVRELEQRLDALGALQATCASLRRDVSEANRERSDALERALAAEAECARLRAELATMHSSGGANADALTALRAENDELRVRLEAALAQRGHGGGGDDAHGLKGVDVDLRSPAMLQWIAMVRESFEGDYAGAARSAAALHAMFEAGDEAHSLVFCDAVQKIGRSAVNDRVLLLAGAHVQLLECDAHGANMRRSTRSIALADLEYVSLSRLHGELVVLHHRTHHDMLLLVPKRAELLFFLTRSYLRATGQRLAYRHAERLYVRDENGMQREVEVFAPQQYRVGKSVLLGT